MIISKIKVIAIIMMIIFISINAQASLQGQTETKENVEWVVMFYLNGDNAISSAINICLNLIKEVGETNDVKIAVLLDKNQVNDTKLYYFEEKTTVEQEWPKESDMSDPETLVEFCKKVKNDFPSNHYCLEITANKGSGWQGINYDDHSNGIMMTMPQLYNAFDEITDNGCMKFDALLIQTCLGGNLEFRYQLNKFCEYYIGYADCGLVGDIPFNDILSTLVSQPSMNAKEFAINTVNLFIPQQYQRIYQAFGATESVQLLSLADTINELALWFIDHLDTIKSDIQSALNETRKYGLQFNIDYYIDLKDFLEHLNIDNSDYLTIKNNVLAKITETVIAKVTLEGYPSCGFNIYFPNKKIDYNNALRYDHALPSPYEETFFAIDTHWDEFLKIFLDITDNTPPDNPTIDGSNKGKPNEEYEYILSSADPQGDKVCFYVDWGDETNEMTALVSSGEEIIVSHTWNTKGAYTIKVKSVDQYSAESDWSILEVNMVKNKSTEHSKINWYFKKLINRFPLFEKILNQLI